MQSTQKENFMICLGDNQEIMIRFRNLLKKALTHNIFKIKHKTNKCEKMRKVASNIRTPRIRLVDVESQRDSFGRSICRIRLVN